MATFRERDLTKGQLRQLTALRKSLGKEDKRVQRIIFLTGNTPLDATLVEQHPGLTIFAADHTLTGEFIAAIESYGTGNVFLVDPLGNLIMRFPVETGMKGIHEDLKKLLKISRIG